MAKSILLDGQESLIDIPLYYKVRTNKYGVHNFQILSDEEGKKAAAQEESDIETLNTRWRPQTWQMNNHLMKHSTSYNQASGTQDIDFQKYRDNVVTECLVEWDMVDPNGQAIPVSEKTIGQMPSVIVNELIRRYDQAMTYNEEEQEKS